MMTPMRKLAAACLLPVTMSCVSGAPRPSPAVRITQVTPVVPLWLAELPLSNSVSNGVPVDYEIELTNPFAYPISVTSVEVETVGVSGAYSMKRVRHAFALVVKPQSTTTLPIRAWVQPLQNTDTGDVNGPVTVRGLVRFDSKAGVMKTAFASRVQ